MFLSNGDGTFAGYATTGGPGGNGAGYVQFADVNGDGLSDLIKTTDDGWVYVFPKPGRLSSLAKAITDDPGPSLSIVGASPHSLMDATLLSRRSRME